MMPFSIAFLVKNLSNLKRLIVAGQCFCLCSRGSRNTFFAMLTLEGEGREPPVYVGESGAWLSKSCL